MSQLWGPWLAVWVWAWLPSLPGLASALSAEGEDSARGQDGRRWVRQDRTRRAGAESLFSDLNRLMFYCFSLPRGRWREIRAQSFQSHLFTLLPNEKCSICASTLNRLWKQGMTISAHKARFSIGVKYSLGEKTKQRDSHLFSCKARRIIFFQIRQHFLFLSVDSHLTPRTEKCLEMKNLKKTKPIKKNII